MSKTKSKEVKQETLLNQQVFDEVSLDALGPDTEESWEKYRKSTKSRSEKAKQAFEAGFAAGRNRSSVSLLRWIQKLRIYPKR